VLAYRAFKVLPSGRLTSPYAKYVWTREGNIAECRLFESLNKTKRREAGDLEPCLAPPGADCLCGFYAYPTLARLASNSTMMSPQHLIGLVSVYGRGYLHADQTLRAEYCTVLALMHYRTGVLDYDPDPNAWTAPSVPNRELVTLAGELLGVPAAAFATLSEGLSWLAAEAQQYDEATLEAFVQQPDMTN
jgi:hypothetical protein